MVFEVEPFSALGCDTLTRDGMMQKHSAYWERAMALLQLLKWFGKYQ